MDRLLMRLLRQVMRRTAARAARGDHARDEDGRGGQPGSRASGGARQRQALRVVRQVSRLMRRF